LVIDSSVALRAAFSRELASPGLLASSHDGLVDLAPTLCAAEPRDRLALPRQDWQVNRSPNFDPFSNLALGSDRNEALSDRTGMMVNI